MSLFGAFSVNVRDQENGENGLEVHCPIIPQKAVQTASPTNGGPPTAMIQSKGARTKY